MTHALDGVRVVELSAKGPAPFGAMLLADFGAEVIRIDRPGATSGADPLGRGRRSIALDLKSPQGVDVLLRLIEHADVLIEAYRPGVSERLGFGPAVCHERNPALIYARMTGWGQTGPLASRAGHDLNFLAIAGALHPLGSAEHPPPPPLNLVGDFGGGGTYLVIGVLLAIIERARSGHGQVIDAAMVDGVANLMTAYHALRAAGHWSDRREANLVDGGAPSYRTYRCADGRFIAVGCLEPGTYRAFLERLQLEPSRWPQHDASRWPDQRAHLIGLFASQPREHWERVFADSDACVSAVLDMGESTRAAHLAERGTFTDMEGVSMPSPAPRLSRTPGRAGPPSPTSGADTDEVLTDLGLSAAEITALRDAGAVC